METEETISEALNKLYQLLNMVEPTSLVYVGLLDTIKILEDRLIELQVQETV